MKEVYELLETLQIKYEKVTHPPLFTCEDCKKHNIEINACNCKNLFLRNDKKTQYYLVCMNQEKAFKIKDMQVALNEKRLSFSSPEDLKAKLGIESGAVSLFNVINIKDDNITVIIDKEIIKDKASFHPNINTETLVIHSNDIETILKHLNIKYKIMNL